MKYAVAVVLTVFSTAALSVECTNPDSDPDGDGWGWENNASCRMPATIIDNGDALSQCLAEGNELEAEITRLKQKIAELEGGNSNTPHCVDTDPVGDGWGWNGSTSCRVGGTDYSNEVPDCQLAANRIEASVDVGMSQTEVRRAVGKPTNITNLDSIDLIIFDYYDHSVRFEAGSVKSFNTFRSLCGR